MVFITLNISLEEHVHPGSPPILNLERHLKQDGRSEEIRIRTCLIVRNVSERMVNFKALFYQIC